MLCHYELQVYDIDGIGSDDVNNIEDRNNGKHDRDSEDNSPNKIQGFDKKNVKSSKQILMNAGQKSEFDSGMNNCQLNQNSPSKDNRSANTDSDTTYCTSKYGQIVSSRENHNQINDIQQKITSSDNKPSSSFRKDCNSVHGKTSQTWDEFSKRSMSSMKAEEKKKVKSKENTWSNGKTHYDFFPVFNNKSNDVEDSESIKDISKEDNSNIVLDQMQKLVLHSTDNNICDNKSRARSFST